MAAAGSPGRNDPCPCGSGRKFKHCCLSRQDAEDSARLRIRNAEGRTLPAVLGFAAEKWGEPLFESAWAEFWLWEDVPADMTEPPEFETMFLPWFAFGFTPDLEAEERQPDWAVEPLGLAWLMSGAGPDDEFDRRYVLQACRSPMSVFSLAAVTPGQSLDVTDILTGRRFHVRELAASRTLHVGDLIFSRVVTVDDVSVLFGTAPYPAPAMWHTHVIDFRESLVRRRLLTRLELEAFDGVIRAFYFHARRALLDPRVPEVRNGDGDTVREVVLTFALRVAAGNAYTRLVPLATIDGEVHEEDVIRDASGQLTSATLFWMNRTGRAPLVRRRRGRRSASRAAEETVLGVLTLAGGRLIAELNSEKRAEALQRLIERDLGPDAELVERRVGEPLSDALHTLKARRGLHLVQPPRVVSPEMAAIEAEARARHWEEWLDMSVPALKGKTPRQAAKTKAGRERLEAILTAAEHDGQPGSRGHVARVRAVLGL